MLDIRKLAILGMVPFLVAAAPASLQFNDEQTEGQQLTEEENEVICRRVRTTGSNIRRRYCMTRAEWVSLSEESQRNLGEGMEGDHQNTDTNSIAGPDISPGASSTPATPAQ